MKDYSKEKADVFSTPEEGLAKLTEIIGKSYTEEEIANVKKAYELAAKVHEGQKRLSGEPYIMHPLSVALILARLGMDDASIIAAMLHDTVEDTDLTNDEIKKEFGDTVAELVDGVTKIGRVPLQTKEEQQAENIRKMLIAMSRDIRVIIIKLADRLHNMRTLMYKPEQRRRDIALETIEIYAPIAHRLGIRPIKEELEDLSISYLDPVAYNDIGKALEQQSKSRNEFLADIKARIEERIKTVVSGAQVSGRIKSVHGIYRKMYMQNKNFDEIYDIYAVRIIVDSVIDCYNCLGVIHDMFKPIPGRFKDYISTPKPNMYQSLHTTVLGKEGIPFEVQIRTWEMHHTAEYGIAAHWKYKLGINGTVKFEERLAWIRQLLENQSDSEDVEDLVSTIKSDLVPEEVFVFTPKGDVFNLPMGATVIDFAYAIHSAVGNKMIGAKVDGRIVPLDYQVKTGEIVEVLTSSQPGKGPSRDWLNIVKTSQARAKIRQWYKKERRDENIAEGKAEVEKEFKRNFIRLAEPEYTEFIKKIAERQHCKSIEDFYAAIGYGGISLMHMMPKIKEDYVKMTKAEEPVINIAPVKKRTKSTEGVVVEGIDNCLIKFSRCCNPLPGDNIIGFITRGHGVSIHTRNCPNVPADISKAGEPDRWVVAYWDTNIREDFKCTLQISCLNRIGLFADVSSLLANMHIMINDISTRNTKDGRTSIMLTVSVNGVEHLNSLTAKLSKISGVLSVERTGV
ncbi:MAG: bifunctional (p)ppGpp synthetase/guanosine-3',5'-bis(diphosphate) 3'-pyrophosphohydrolase [Clostridium sp.]|jgi:guanosine-3',5'-bis(diphosphate) 3'-pyrophosphohydrolase|nr:bifunctional (p)ppGpp synthetase/guanosine-3',5'-bis(diphosphate) 3'-pyrophosphohydrolase [Clostridium sp.]